MRSKTLMPGEFISPWQIKSGGVPRRTKFCGAFGADMQVFSQNDGPVTILLDTDTL